MKTLKVLSPIDIVVFSLSLSKYDKIELKNKLVTIVIRILILIEILVFVDSIKSLCMSQLP